MPSVPRLATQVCDEAGKMIISNANASDLSQISSLPLRLVLAHNDNR